MRKIAKKIQHAHDPIFKRTLYQVHCNSWRIVLRCILSQNQLCIHIFIHVSHNVCELEAYIRLPRMRGNQQLIRSDFNK